MDSQKTLNQIISGGYCIGCGACASVSEDIDIKMQSDGQYRAQLDSELERSSAFDNALSVCPFFDEGPNEDDLGKSLFESGGRLDSRIGWHRNLYAGHVAEGTFREKGASGGVITWLLTQMLEKGMIDAVIHVHKVDPKEDGILFKYAISRTTEMIAEGAKSRYYPIEISEVMDEVRKTPGRYVFVGLPCFVKAVRRLAVVDDVIRERVVYCVGLVCGHLKSKAFADCFAWQVGIPPGKLEEIDFRVKIPDRAASAYSVLLRSADTKVIKSTRELFGANWGHNFFRYSACDYCDDVFAETADMSVGDAWLPGYSDDSGGNSVVVVRNPDLGILFNEAQADERTCLDSISADLMAESQAGGLRDRREGLAYRLYLKESAGAWAPIKRVQPSCEISRDRKKVYDARLKLSLRVYEAWQEALSSKDFERFKKKLALDIIRVNNCYEPFQRQILILVKFWVLKLSPWRSSK